MTEPSSPTPEPKPVTATPAVAPAGGAITKPITRADFLWTGWAMLAAFFGASAAATARFFFPNVIYEPSQKFNAGPAKGYDVGVSTKWLSEQRVWIIRNDTGIYVLWARCTHLGCTPNWWGDQNRFKCPCHGSNYTIQGDVIAGPAPRPLWRAKVELSSKGDLIVDKAVLEDIPGKRELAPYFLAMSYIMPTLDIEKIKKEIIDSQIWRSVFRGGVWKDTPRDRSAHIIGNVWLHLHPVRVRKRALEWTYTWGLGGISFALYLILTVTGVLLMFYYRPTIDLAYRDIKDLEFAITLGKLMRNMHRWAAQAMVVGVIAHMVSVFLRGAYKKPREFNWGVGVLLLTLTLFLSFTGYLLPWDQLAIWAVTVGTNMAGATPFLGNEGPMGNIVGAHINNDVRFALLGGTMVGENTLLRFYVMHCVAVPLVVGILLILHFWRIRKDSFSAAPYEPNEEKVEVWPHLVKREYIAAAACLLFMFVWSIWMNAPLEVIANPNVTPNPSKAPWYFVGLQELLVYFDPWIAGVVMPGLIIVGLMAIPYIDTNPKGVGYYAWNERKFANTGFMLGIVMWFTLIAIGYWFRGPNFFWYWPWESWLMTKAAPALTWNVFGPNPKWHMWCTPNLSAFPLWLGIPIVGGAGLASLVLPKLIQRELNGWKANLAALGGLAAIAVLMRISPLHVSLAKGAWLVAFGWMHFYFGFLLPQRYIRALDWARYLVTMALVLSTTAVLLKMCARLAFDIKYLITIPTISMNI